MRVIVASTANVTHQTHKVPDGNILLEVCISNMANSAPVEFNGTLRVSPADFSLSIPDTPDELFVYKRDVLDLLKIRGQRQALELFCTVPWELRDKASVARADQYLLAEPEALLVINSVRTLLNYLGSRLHGKRNS